MMTELYFKKEWQVIETLLFEMALEPYPRTKNTQQYNEIQKIFNLLKKVAIEHVYKIIRGETQEFAKDDIVLIHHYINEIQKPNDA